MNSEERKKVEELLRWVKREHGVWVHGNGTSKLVHRFADGHFSSTLLAALNENRKLVEEEMAESRAYFARWDAELRARLRGAGGRPACPPATDPPGSGSPPDGSDALP